MEYVKRNEASIVFADGLLAEVVGAAGVLDVSVPDFIEAALRARLTALRAEADSR